MECKSARRWEAGAPHGICFDVVSTGAFFLKMEQEARKMVDTYGRWTYEPDTPEEKKCDMDRIADWIMEAQYVPKTSIENLAIMIVAHFDCPDNYGEYDPQTGSGGYGTGFTIDGCKRYVEDSGGFSEFDYEV